MLSITLTLSLFDPLLEHDLWGSEHVHTFVGIVPLSNQGHAAPTRMFVVGPLYHTQILSGAARCSVTVLSRKEALHQS